MQVDIRQKLFKINEEILVSERDALSRLGNSRRIKLGDLNLRNVIYDEMSDVDLSQDEGESEEGDVIPAMRAPSPVTQSSGKAGRGAPLSTAATPSRQAETQTESKEAFE